MLKETLKLKPSERVKMIKTNYFVMTLMLAATLSLAPASTPSRAGSPQDDLKVVLDKMNARASGFAKAKADFEWVVYTAVVKQSDIQTGQIYYRRGRNGPDSDAIAIRVVSPAQKHIVVADGKFKMYEPKLDQNTERALGKDRAEYEQAMRLGFGSRGSELLASFEVKLLGWETVDGVNTAKLELIPTVPSYQKAFQKVFFWIDTDRDIALKQQFFQASGDYRLVHNTNIDLKSTPPNDAFAIEHGHNKVVIH
jgi:outer membrane lipoprotein-sorting protein